MNWVAIPRLAYAPIYLVRFECGHSIARTIPLSYNIGWCPQCTKYFKETHCTAYYWATPATIQAIG